ncbi:MAG: hypothetical protein ACU0B9_05090 [Limimaricola soesokkakensis]|uniref:hypothetical protein n=1 Tax=Limimaricola soesokkakensis TaxID=1343159 RepID=UPI00405A1A91
MKNLSTLQIIAATLALAAVMFAIVLLTFMTVNEIRASAATPAFAWTTVEIDGESFPVLVRKGEGA